MRKKNTQADFEKTLKKVSAPSSTANESHKEMVRQAAISQMQKQQSGFSFFRYAVPAMAGGFGVIAIVVGLGLISPSTSVDTPSEQNPVAKLTSALGPEEVKATAISSLEESIAQQEQIAVQPNKFVYTKSRIGAIDEADGTEEKIVESWEDPDTGDSKTVVYDELENELSSTIVRDGSVYTRYNFGNYNDYYQRINADNQVFPGAAAIGVTTDTYERYSMKELDDKLEEAGLARHYEQEWGNTDFEGYTVPFEEIFSNSSEENARLFPDESSYFVQGGQSQQQLDSQVAVQDFVMMIQAESLSDERSEMLTTLQGLASVETVEEQWHGVDCIGIHNAASSDTEKETWYFDVQDAEFVGSQTVFLDSAGEEAIKVYELKLDEATVTDADFDTNDHVQSDVQQVGEVTFSEPAVGVSFTVPAEFEAKISEPINSGREYGADFLVGPVKSYADVALEDDCGPEASEPQTALIGRNEDIEAQVCDLEGGVQTHTFDVGPRTIEIVSQVSEDEDSEDILSIEPILSSIEITQN